MIYRVFLMVLICTLSVSKAFSQLETCKVVGYQQIPEWEKPLQGKAFANKYPNNESQFFSDWNIADIYVDGKIAAKNKMLRYNALIDEMLWMRESDFQVVVLNRNQIDKVWFHNKGILDEYILIKIDKKNIQHPEHSDMFVQLLSKPPGKVLLLKKIDAIEDQATYKIKQAVGYYVYINNEYHRVSNSKAFFLKIFEDDKLIMKQILNENRLSIKNEQGLIRAIDIYNSQKKE